jgi:3-methyladenine DNA glycosylase AlkC
MEPFKNLFNKPLVQGMATHFGRHDKKFNQKAFARFVLKDFDKLELKERSNKIVEGMAKYLPDDFPTAAKIMLASLNPDPPDDLYGIAVTEAGLAGWAIMSMGEYVGLYGQQDFNLSMKLLKEMTSRFTSESAIRHFFIANPRKTLKAIKPWTRDKNRHVRRLVSEGSRPLLPWSPKIQAFVEDPALILPLLEALRHDREEYVRRSVANNLNDIAKHHPDLVADTAKHWLKGASKDEQRMVRHACRTLLKQGHQGALSAFGYGDVSLTVNSFDIQTTAISLGQHLVFDMELTSSSNQDQPLMIDFVIHHRKANGSTSPKVFKWKTLNLKAGETVSAQKKHGIKPITTRVYYSGAHFLELQINGQSMAKVAFDLDCT